MDKWTKFSDEKPDYDMLILVWRSQRERYTISRRKKSHDDEGNDEDCWVTEHGSVHEIKPDDVWLEFPPYWLNKIYK